MMTKRNLTALTCLTAATLTLSACVTREQADAKLAEACQAGAEAFMEEGYEIKDIASTEFSGDGTDNRTVTMNVLETDGWANLDKVYSCVFKEQFSFGNTAHNATILKLDTGDKVVGQTETGLVGTMEDFSKLVEASEKVLN